MNGSETMTALASIMSMTVDGVLAPTAPGRCAGSAGAASSGWRRASTGPGRSGRSRRGAGEHADGVTVVRRPRRPVRPPSGGPARVPLARCGAPDGGVRRSPCPLRLLRALGYIVLVNLLTTTSLGSGAQGPGSNAPPAEGPRRRRAHTIGERLVSNRCYAGNLRRQCTGADPWESLRYSDRPLPTRVGDKERWKT